MCQMFGRMEQHDPKVAGTGTSNRWRPADLDRQDRLVRVVLGTLALIQAMRVEIVVSLTCPECVKKIHFFIPFFLFNLRPICRFNVFSVN